MTEQMLRTGPNHRGLGFSTFEAGGHRYFEHGGSNVGFRCRLVASAEADFGVAIMTNGEIGDYVVDELLRAVAAEYGWPGFGNK
jgi:hypothetical protein